MSLIQQSSNCMIYRPESMMQTDFSSIYPCGFFPVDGRKRIFAANIEGRH